MQTMSTSSTHAAPQLMLRPSFGYRFDGDEVWLNAELSPTTHGSESPRPQRLLLQLWASDTPFGGGMPTGHKIAELAFDDALLSRPFSLSGKARATPPLCNRRYFIALSVAFETSAGLIDIQDYAAFDNTERFAGPALGGEVGYAVHDSHVELQAERIYNSRPLGNLSGSLTLQLRARPLDANTNPGMDADCVASEAVETLAEMPVERLQGQYELRDIRMRVPFAPPNAERSQLVLELREWCGQDGFLTRDSRTFAMTYHRDEVKPTDPQTPSNVIDLETAAKRLFQRGASAASAAPTTPRPPAKRMSPPATQSVETEPAPPQAQPKPALVSLQHADVQTLIAVPGINPRLAAAIIRMRPLRSIDDLLKVRGIGHKLLRKIRPHVQL